VKRRLASLLAAVMLWSLAPVLHATVPRAGESSIGAAEPDGAPAEPSAGESWKLPAATVLETSVAVEGPSSQGFVPAASELLGPGELHSPRLERPPTTSSLS
jgi:hypothetical protein